MASRLQSLDRLQILGVLLIAVVIAASATWRAEGSPTPQIFGAVNSRIEVDPRPQQVDNRPQAVQLAEDVLGARLRVSASQLPAGVRMTSPSADVRVICAEHVCAALRGSTDTYAYAKGKEAAAKALTLLLHPEVASVADRSKQGRSR